MLAGVLVHDRAEGERSPVILPFLTEPAGPVEGSHAALLRCMRSLVARRLASLPRKWPLPPRPPLPRAGEGEPMWHRRFSSPLVCRQVHGILGMTLGTVDQRSCTLL